MRTWRVYLEGSKYQVQVYTDHKNLVYFTTTKELNRRQVRWSELLSTYNFKISYVKGTDNARADALSRKPEYLENKTHPSHAILKEDEDGLVFNHEVIAATTMTITRHEEFDKMYETDELAKSEKVARINGKILWNDRIYVPEQVREDLVRTIHELPAHGHQGIFKTIKRVSQEYGFPGLKEVVTRVVKNCDTCTRNKSDRHAPYGQMKSPDTPQQPWKSIAWDFVVKLPPSREPTTQIHYDSILVITERLTKYAYMLPWKEKYTAEDLAYVFNRVIIANHGLPDEIISDRDKLFTSKFWKSITALLGVKLKMSTAFHPQTDGQTERLNQTMEAYLRCYVNYQQNNWVQLLPTAQFAHNSAVSETTKVSPFYANYGFEPRAYGSTLPGATAQKAMIEIEKIRNLHKQLRENVQKASLKAASYYNAKRSVEPTLKKGDKVYLLRKNIKTKRPSDKLDNKKLGPFEIKEVKGPVNYELRLPKSMNIHPVFHVSLLELAPPGAPKAPTTEIEPVNPEEEYEVEQVLDCRLVRGKTKYLVRWKGYSQSEDSWEPKRNLTGSVALVKEFHRRNPGLPRSDRKDLRRKDLRRQAGKTRPENKQAAALSQDVPSPVSLAPQRRQARRGNEDHDE